jgi:precorrin-6Y C5,15-methyltransferase (decarboxylating)
VGRRDAGQAGDAAAGARLRLLVNDRAGADGRSGRARAAATAQAFDLGRSSRSTPSRSRSSAAGHGAQPRAGLDDSLFEHDGQLTKRDVRAITVSALAPRQGELLWDVGLGAGSVAIEWLLRHPSLKAIGIEEGADARPRAARNAAALGTPDLQIVQGLRRRRCRLAAPDAVFIGGGLGDAGCSRRVVGAEAGRPAGRQRRVARSEAR